MNSEKVKEIKELLRCMNGEKAYTNCYINDIAQEQETCCINIVADMTLDLIDELEKENTEQLKQFAEKLKDSGVVKALLEIGAMSPICKKIHDEIVKSIDQNLKEFIND